MAASKTLDFRPGGIHHYRNGREAKNGDKIVRLSGEGKVEAFGRVSAVAGNDYCNGNIAVCLTENAVCATASASNDLVVRVFLKRTGTTALEGM